MKKIVVNFRNTTKEWIGMTKKQRVARLKEKKRLEKERRVRELSIFQATYGRQVTAVVKFWSEQLTNQAADFDNGERDEVQIRAQVTAIAAHAEMAAHLTPGQVQSFEQALTKAIIRELKYMIHLSVGLRYEPESDSVLAEALWAAGIRPSKLVFPWDHWTHIGPNGVRVCHPGGEEDLLLQIA